MRVLTLAALALVVPTAPPAQSAQIVFDGTPTRKVEATGNSVLSVELTAAEAARYRVQIVEQDGRYFWATREMTELRRTQSGVYTTYVATNGSGYIRIVRPDVVDMGDIEYTEHLLLGLASITYYGRRSR